MQGEAAKKLKGNFWFAHHYDLQKVSFKAPFRIEGFFILLFFGLVVPEALRVYRACDKARGVHTLQHLRTARSRANARSRELLWCCRNVS